MNYIGPIFRCQTSIVTGPTGPVFQERMNSCTNPNCPSNRITLHKWNYCGQCGQPLSICTEYNSHYEIKIDDIKKMLGNFVPSVQERVHYWLPNDGSYQEEFSDRSQEYIDQKIAFFKSQYEKELFLLNQEYGETNVSVEWMTVLLPLSLG